MDYLINFISRASRLRFWTLLILQLSFVVNAKNPNIIRSEEYFYIEILVLILALVTFIGRANDCGKHFLWGVAIYVPIINLVALYYLGFTPSKK